MLKNLFLLAVFIISPVFVYPTDTFSQEVVVPITLKGKEVNYTVADPSITKIYFRAQAKGNDAKATNWQVTGVGKVSIELKKLSNINSSQKNSSRKKGHSKKKKGRKKRRKNRKKKRNNNIRGEAGSHFVKLKSYPQFQKGQFEFDLSDYTQSSLFAAEASCTPPSQEEFFAGVPPEFLTQIIDAFLQLFPPGTTIDEAIAQVSCPDSNNNLSSGDIPTGTPGEQINDPEIPYGYISANTVIPFDACSPRKTQYEVQVVVDLSEVSKEILHKQPMITVSVKAYKPQRDQRALIKPNSEGGGACHSATIVLAKTTGSYYGEKLDVVHWSQGTFNKIKSFPIYKGYFSNYAKYCVQPYLTGRRENFIMYNVSRTAAYSFCARFAQKRQELNGY